MSATVIRLEQVRRGFDGKLVLSGLDLDVSESETFSILGGSGIGKSVTLKLLIGLLRADQGRVLFRGRDLTHLKEREWVRVRRNFGMVFQGAALFDSLTVLENVAYPLREHLRSDEATIRRTVSEKLALVGLEGIEATLPSELSGGMRKRVAVARAIALEPEVILYDEPTSGLDPSNAGRIGELIRNLQQRLGVTSIVVTHDLGLCRTVSDRVGLLRDGHLVWLGSPHELHNSADPEIRGFLQGAFPDPGAMEPS